MKKRTITPTEQLRDWRVYSARISPKGRRRVVVVLPARKSRATMQDAFVTRDGKRAWPDLQTLRLDLAQYGLGVGDDGYLVPINAK